MKKVTLALLAVMVSACGPMMDRIELSRPYAFQGISEARMLERDPDKHFNVPYAFDGEVIYVNGRDELTEITVYMVNTATWDSTTFVALTKGDAIPVARGDRVRILGKIIPRRVTDPVYQDSILRLSLIGIWNRTSGRLDYAEGYAPTIDAWSKGTLFRPLLPGEGKQPTPHDDVVNAR